MPKILIVFIFFIFHALSSFAQVNAVRNLVDSTKVILDKNIIQDTVKQETKAARKAREKIEKEKEKENEKAAKERAKYYYKDILKDSTRLHIEHLSDIAWKRSAILPGWGQITNGGKYLWIKLPIIYGGFITAYFVFDYWNWYYRKFVKEAAYRTDNPGTPGKDPDLIGYESLAGLIKAKDSYKRYRDMTVLITAVWWAGNVVEAYTDSMLRNRYNISDNLGMKINPTLLPVTGSGLSTSLASQFAPGVKITFNF